MSARSSTRGGLAHVSRSARVSNRASSRRMQELAHGQDLGSVASACGRSAVGSASPCQGEGRGFESRRPLDAGSHHRSRWNALLGGMAERRGNGLQSRVHGFESRSHLDVTVPPITGSGSRRTARAISSAGERFPDTEEVTGSIPVSPTMFSQLRGTMADSVGCTWGILPDDTGDAFTEGSTMYLSTAMAGAR